MKTLNNKEIDSAENLTVLNANTCLKIFIGDRNIGDLFNKEQQMRNSEYYSIRESWNMLVRLLIDSGYARYRENTEPAIFEIHFNSQLLAFIGFDNFKLREKDEMDLCRFLENIEKVLI